MSVKRGEKAAILGGEKYAFTSVFYGVLLTKSM